MQEERGGGPKRKRGRGLGVLSGLLSETLGWSEEKGAERVALVSPPQLETALSGRPDPVGTAAFHRPIPVTSSGTSEARARG